MQLPDYIRFDISVCLKSHFRNKFVITKYLPSINPFLSFWKNGRQLSCMGFKQWLFYGGCHFLQISHLKKSLLFQHKYNYVFKNN